MATSKVRFKANPRGVQKLATSKDTKKDLSKRGQKLVERAKQNAPKPGTHPYATGDYENSLTHDVIETSEGYKLLVYSTDWKAHLVEWDTAHTRGQHPISNAVTDLGYKLDDAGKGNSRTIT